MNRKSINSLFEVLLELPMNVDNVIDKLYGLKDTDLALLKNLMCINELYPNLNKENFIDTFRGTDAILGISEGLIVLKQGIIFRYSRSYLEMKYQNNFLGDCYLGDFSNLTQAIEYCMSVAGLNIPLTRNDLEILLKINGDINEEECV